jgi:hypothetical protein
MCILVHLEFHDKTGQKRFLQRYRALDLYLGDTVSETRINVSVIFA